MGQEPATEQYVNMSLKSPLADIARHEEWLGNLSQQQNALSNSLTAVNTSLDAVSKMQVVQVDDGKKLLWFMITQLAGIVFLFLKEFAKL